MSSHSSSEKSQDSSSICIIWLDGVYLEEEEHAGAGVVGSRVE